MRVSALSPRVAVLLLLAVVCLSARVASAVMYLAPTTAYTPLANFSQLKQACAAQHADGLPLAMYDTSIASSVVAYMNSQKTTTAFVSAYLSDGGLWVWDVTESGTTVTITVNSSQFLAGELDHEKTNYRYAAFDASRQGLITTTRYGGFPVLCGSQTFSKVPSKGFPWWAILIIVLAVVVIVVIVIVVVCCCCCRKKKSYDDADDEDSSAITSRSGSFVSGSTSRGTKTDGSSSFSTSRGTSFSESKTDGSSVVSESESGGSSLASSSRGTSRSGATSQSSTSSSAGGAFSEAGVDSYADPRDGRY